MKFLIVGLVLIILWVLGTFVANLATGWVHAPLAVGSVLIAMGIVVSGENGSAGGKGSGERGAGSSK